LSDQLSYDGAARAITKRYLAGGIDVGTDAYEDPTSVVGFTTAYDKSSNKLFERHLHAESRSHLYQPIGALPLEEGGGTGPLGGYDSLDRLRQYQRGALASGGGSVTSPISLPNTDELHQYVLDGVGNWRRNISEPVGGALATEVRQHNSLNQLAKYGATACLYDKNGNLLDDGLRLYFWDALNRLASIRRKSDGLVIGAYTYDALNRRVRKVVSNGGLSGTIPNGTTDFLLLGWRCVEERNGSNVATKQYVWGIYLDELLQQKHLVTINGHAAGVYYPLSDLLYRTVALTDSSGDIIEAYDTDAYGNTLIFSASGTGGDWWADNATQTKVATCEFIFTGQRMDSECEVYHFKQRMYLPRDGRFASRDSMNREDPYFFLDDNPLNRTDPSGFGPCSAAAVAPWWSLVVGYGNFCGFARAAVCAAVDVPAGPPTNIPRDALDAACMQHDCCLFTLAEIANPIREVTCNLALCLAAAHPLVCAVSPYPFWCRITASDILRSCYMIPEFLVLPLP